MAGLSNLLQRLPPIRKGMNIFDVVTADRMQAIQDLLRALARGDNIASGLNVRKKSGDGWVLVTAISGRSGGSSSASVLPWASALTKDESGNNIVSVGEGKIYHALDNPVPRDFSLDELVFPAHTGIVAGGDKVFLQIDYDPPGDITSEDTVAIIDSASGDWGSAGVELSTWEDDPESPDYDKQLIGRIPICQVDLTDPENPESALVLTQIAKHDWWMDTRAFSGRLVDWPTIL